MTKSVAFYVSDYGYGHASRVIAVIRALHHSDKKLVIHVRTFGPFTFVRKSCPNCKVQKSKNDIGVICDSGTFLVDEDKSLKKACLWYEKNRSEYFSKEIRFLKKTKVHVVFSDIPPYPLELASSLAVPSIAMSNFNWYWIYINFKHACRCQFPEVLRKAYEKTSLALLLPLHEGMQIFKTRIEIPLVTRQLTKSPTEIRRRLEIKESEKLIFLSVGRSLKYDNIFLQKLSDLAEKIDAKFLLSSGVLAKRELIKTIPTGEVESQNYVAACDFVATKTGYSVVSESIANKIPLLLVNRVGFAEDEVISQRLSGLGIAKTLNLEQFRQLRWLERLEDYLSLKKNYASLPSIFKPTGANMVANTITEFLKK